MPDKMLPIREARTTEYCPKCNKTVGYDGIKYFEHFNWCPYYGYMPSFFIKAESYHETLTKAPKSDVTEISNIVSDLMKVGATIPDLSSKCESPLEDLIMYAYSTLSDSFLLNIMPPDSVKGIAAKGRQSSVSTIKSGMKEIRDFINGNLERNELISAEDAHGMITILDSALGQLEARNWHGASENLDKFRRYISEGIADMASNCACARKGDIISGVYHGINVHKEVDPTHKNIIWQDQIAALNRHGILTNEEADRLLKVRW